MHNIPENDVGVCRNIEYVNPTLPHQVHFANYN